MYSAYKLNKHGDNIQLWCTPFPIWNQSVVACPVLTVASWPAYRFLRRQVRWSGIPISSRIFHSLLNPHSQRLLPEPAGKVDQVPRTCTTRLRKNTTTKMGSRGSDTSPQREAVWPWLYSASYIYTGEREKDKTVNILLGWPIHLTKSHKKSWEHGNGTLLLFLTPDNISLWVRSLSRTPGVCSK